MQTFLPLPSIVETAKVLDYRRLGKQRVEAKQIINAIQTGKGGWVDHPALKMWTFHIEGLKLYHDIMIIEWIKRGYNNSMKLYNDKNKIHDNLELMPDWFGQNDFHASHRSNLLRKNQEYYSQFNWSEPLNLEYIWPVDKQ